MGGSLIPVANSKDFDRKQEKQNAKREKRKKRAPALTILNIDAGIRQMHRFIGLTTKDKEHLKTQRGLTDEQIAKGLYFSVGSYQELPSGIPANFPGVDWTGRNLTNRYPGIACVLFNPEGNAIGLQLRVLDSTEEGRYRWVSNQSNRAHLANGELPLTYIRPEEIKHKHPALLEGTGFKPQIAAEHLGQIMIGAAGGQHPSSPQQLDEYLKFAAAHGLDTNIIQLYLDAGDVLNDHVMHRVVSTIDLLESWGKAVEIAWWGQVAKTAPDIDELKDLSVIEYIPAREFEPLKRFRAGLPGIDFDEPPITEPPPEAYAEHLEAEQALEREVELQKEREKAISLQNTAVAAKNNWRRWKKFTPDKTINEPYFKFKLKLVMEQVIIAVKSGLGTGKTEWLKRVIAQDPHGWIALGYRNSLLLQACERWGFYHLHQDSAFNLIADPNGAIACCVDSLPHFQPHHFDGKKLILDEVMSIIIHILAGGTLKGKRQDQCLELFTEALRRAKAVYILDGNLADWAVEYISSLTPGKKVIKIENKYEDPQPLDIQLLDGTTADGSDIKTNDKSPLVTLIKEECHPEVGMVPGIATDSQIFAESLDNILKKSGLCGLRVDSKTISEDWCKDFLKKPNLWIAQNKPDYLIYSPTAEGGLDISIKNYFTKQFGIFFGVLGVDSILQMLGRIRDRNISRVVWTREFTRNDQEISRSSFAHTIHKNLIKYMVQDALMSFDGHIDAMAIGQKIGSLIERSQDEHFRAKCIIAAIHNYESQNLREALVDTLEHGNYDLYSFILESDKNAWTALSEATNEVKDQNSIDIHSAEDINAQEASRLEGVFGANWETRCKVIKAKLLSRLPGIEHTDQWTPQLVRHIQYDDKQFINKCELAWFLEHPEVAKRLQQEQWTWLTKQEKKTYLGNFRSRYSAVAVLREAGFMELLNLDKKYREDDPELVEFHRTFKASKKKQRALGMNVGNSTPMHWFVRVVKRVGLALKKKQLRENGARPYEHWIDPASWNHPYRQAILDTLPERWRQYLGDFEPEAICEAETLAQPAVNPDFTHPLNVIEPGEVKSRINDEKEGENLPQNLQAEIQEVISFLVVSLNNNLEGLTDILITVRHLLKKIPQLKKALWGGLSMVVKQAIQDVAPEDYRWLTDAS